MEGWQELPAHIQMTYSLRTCYICSKTMSDSEMARCIKEQSLVVCDTDRPQMVADIDRYAEELQKLQQELSR